MMQDRRGMRAERKRAGFDGDGADSVQAYLAVVVRRWWMDGHTDACASCVLE